MEIRSDITTSRLTWDNSSFGYHFGSKPLVKGQYRFSFKAKLSIADTGQTLGITFRDATDCVAFKVISSFSGKRVQIGQKLTDDWAEYYFDIDLSVAAAKAGLGDVPTEEEDPEGCYKSTTDENIQGITIVLWRNVAKDYSIFFKDMKFEKVAINCIAKELKWLRLSQIFNLNQISILNQNPLLRPRSKGFFM